MSEVRSVSVRLSAKTSEYIAGMGAAARSTDSLGASLARVEARGAGASRGLAGLKKASLYGAGAVVAGLGLAEKAAADFGEKMALVQTLSHANEQQMKQLSSAAMNAGVNIGYTAGQVADGEAEMIKAGVSLRDILKGGLKGALDLAAAGQTDVATATSIAAAAMTEFRLKGKDIPHLADLLSAGADKALGSVEDLGYGLEQAGTTAHQMGLSVEQTTGTLAAFAQAGLIGERGGTTLKQMLLQLASPTKNAQQLMDAYGLSLYNANGQIKSMPELADNLHRAFDRLTPAQRNAAMGTIFGSRAIQGANILMAEGGKGIAEWIRKVNDQGFAAHQASGKLNSLKGDLAKFKGEVQNDLINLGTGGQSPLRHLVQGATQELHKLRTNGDLKRWGNEISDTFTTIGRDALPVAKQVGHALGIIGHDLGVVAKGFQKLPDGVQQAIVTGGVVAYGAHKLGVDSLLKGALGAGGRGGGGGLVAGMASRAAPIPVFVTNPGFGGPGVPSGSVGGSVGAAARNAGVAGALTTGLGSIGLLGGIAIGGFGAASSAAIADRNKQLPMSQFWAAEAAAKAKEAAAATREWARQQAGLNTLLVGPALPKYAAQLQTLPKKVQTEIATPGAVTSLSDVSRLAKQYDLTPKQVRTVVELANAGKVKADATEIGRLYNLTPKQVQTLISQAGMDSSQASIRRLANLYDLTPKQVRTIVTASTGNASAAIARIRAQLDAIPRSISTSYYVNQINRANKGPVTGPGSTGADGATVPKTGRPYADRHPYLLADGEEVVSNRYGQADRWRPLLKAISAGRLADGGTVGARSGLSAAEWRSAAGSFDLTGGMDRRQARAEIVQFARAIRRAGGHLADGFGRLEHEAVGTAGALHRTAGAIDDERARRQQLRSDRSQLISTVKGTFLSDLFAQQSATPSGFAWLSKAQQAAYGSANGGGGVLGTLRSDIADERRFGSLSKRLRAAGVRGNALAYAQSQGVEALDQLAGMSPAQLRSYQRLYDRRAHLAGAVGRQAGAERYAAELQTSNRHLAQMVAEQQRMRAQINHLEKALEHAVVDAGHAFGKELVGAHAQGHRKAKGRRQDGRG